MKKTVFFLILLIFSRIGVSYAAGTNPIGIGDFFTGNNIANLSDANINQVLGLLVGPSGTPGPAGVAGKDGFNGLNGINGMPGAPGATGATGPAGPAGAPGAPGAQGKDGQLTGSAAFAGGAAVVAVCGNPKTDPGLTVNINPKFTGTGFAIASIVVGNVSKDCVDKTLSLYFQIKVSTSFIDKTKETKYPDGALITCTFPLDAKYLGSDLNKITLDHKSTPNNVVKCTSAPSVAGDLFIDDIMISDLDDVAPDIKTQTSTNIGITIS